MSSIIERARQLRAQSEVNASTMEDETAIEYPELFPKWNEDRSYAVGARVRYDGVLYKCLTAHTAQPEWNPADAPSLWARVLPGQGGTEIGVWEQPGSTNGYMTGDRVYYPDADGDIYESTIDNNVWSPADYPQGWQIVTE